MIQIISIIISIHRFDLEDFRYNNVNMTAFRLVDADNEEVQQLLYEMETLSPLGAAILNKSQVMENVKNKPRKKYGKILLIILLHNINIFLFIFS